MSMETVRNTSSITRIYQVCVEGANGRNIYNTCLTFDAAKEQADQLHTENHRFKHPVVCLSRVTVNGMEFQNASVAYWGIKRSKDKELQTRIACERIF